MKLITSIKPRLDGTVVLRGRDGQAHVFKREGADLVCDIEHEPTILMAIESGSFYPATEADEEAASQLVEEAGTADDETDEGEETLESDPNAPPIEGASAAKPAAKKTRAKR